MITYTPDMLEALKKLYSYYARIKTHLPMADCGLCQSAEDTLLEQDDDQGVCDHCAWMIMEKMSCCGFAEAYFRTGAGEVCTYRRTRKNKEWNKIRVEQLARWIEHYKQHLGEEVQ